MNTFARISTDQAIAVLCEGAVADPFFVANEIAKATQRDPHGIMALLKAAAVAALGDVAAAGQLPAQKRFPLVIGQPVTDQGISFGCLKSGCRTIRLNLIPDYLRDASGTPVALNGIQAIEAITALNGGVRYGNGYESAIGSAVSRGAFRDGTLILARRTDLLRIARERNTNPALKEMNEMIPRGASWCVSSTEDRDNPSGVYRVRLKDGYCLWDSKDDRRSCVVVLRGFNCG